MSSKSMANFKAPPSMREDLSYADWVKEIKIWKNFTDLEPKRQGAALFLTLAGKARDTVRAEVEETEMAKDTGVDTIIKNLDKIYLKDDNQSAYTAYDEFVKYRRPASMKIREYITEFNLKYS